MGILEDLCAHSIANNFIYYIKNFKRTQRTTLATSPHRICMKNDKNLFLDDSFSFHSEEILFVVHAASKLPRR